MSEQTAVLGPARRLEAGPRSQARSMRVFVAAFVVIAAIGYLIYNGFQSTSVYYMTVNELKARGGGAGAVRLAGYVADDSVQRSTTDSTIRFVVTDGSGTIPVVYSGLVPDIFGPGVEVVVEGHYTNGEVFEANTLLAKCPSKFEAAVPTPVTAH